MDKEQLLSFLEKNHVSFREMINFLPLGARPGELWTEVLSRRRDKSISLPLHDANGHPYWYITTDRMVAASNRIIEDFIAQATAFDPFRAEAPSSLLEEAYFTSYVEGFTLSLQDAMAFLRANREPRDIREQLLLNNRNTLAFLCANLYPTVDERYLQTLSYFLTDKMDNGNGLFRQADMQRIPFMQNERYVLPPAMSLMDRLREIIRFLGDNNVHPLIRAAVGQVWPIVAQPFQEGNERLGRMISLLVLYRAGYTFLGDVALSSLISRSTYAYYNALTNILREENGGDLTYFIAYFLDLLAKAVEERPGVMEQRRIMEQTVIVDDDCIVTEGTVTDTPDIVTDNSSSGNHQNATGRGVGSAERGSASRGSSGLGEMQEAEGGDAVDETLKAKIISLLRSIPDKKNVTVSALCSKILLSYIEAGQYSFHSKSFFEKLGRSKASFDYSIAKLKEHGIIYACAYFDGFAVYSFRFYTPAHHISKRNNTTCSFLRNRKKLQTVKDYTTHKHLPIVSMHLLRCLDENKTDFYFSDIIEELNLLPHTLSDCLSTLRRMGIVQLDPAASNGWHYYLIDDDQLCGIELASQNECGQFTNNDKRIVAQKLDTFLQSTETALSKSCVRLLQQFLEAGKNTFHWLEIAGDINGTRKQIVGLLSIYTRYNILIHTFTTEKSEDYNFYTFNRNIQTTAENSCEQPCSAESDNSFIETDISFPNPSTMPDRCSNEPLSERHDSIFNKLLCIINSPSSSAFSKACASQLQDFRRENKIEFTVTDFSEISPNKNKGIGAVLNSYCKKGILTVVHFSGRHTVYSFSDRIEKKVPPSFSITQMASIRSCLEKLIATSKNESTHACCNRLISFLNEKKFLFTFNDLYIPSQDNHNKVSGLLSSLVFHHYLKIVGGTAKACEYSFDCPSDDFVLPFSSQQIAVITNKLDLYISSPRQSETKRIGQQLRNYLEVGQFFFCSKDLSDSLGLSVDKVRSSLGYLQSLKIVRRTSTSQTIKKESQEFSFDPSVSPIFTVKSTAQYSTEETQDKYLYRLLKHEEISKGVSNQLARLLIEYYRNGKESFSFYDISERLYIDHIKARKMLYNLLTAGYIKQYQRLVADHHFYVTYTYNTDEKLSSSPDQHQAFARAAYETFGNSEFSREMIIASVDYNENSLGAVLHDLTAMKILSCREDEETRYQYRFLVNPKDNPEYFATNTQQSFLADGKLSLLTDEKVPDGTQSFPPDEEAPNETVPDAEMLGAEGAAV